MSRTVPQERRVDGPSSFGEEICHIVTEEDPDTKSCPECTSAIPIKARRCPQCTAQLVTP